MATPTIPLDIIESVIDVIATDKDTRSLKAVSQTCHTLLPLCHKHIFSTIQLSHKSDNSEHFNDLLSTNPDIARYVKHLHYGLINPSDDDQQVLDALQKRSYLRSVQLWSKWRADWSTFPPSIRWSLLSLIQLPTITHLSIRSFTNFPATALLPCRNLIDLQMERLEMTSLEVKRLSRCDKIPTPISLNAKRSSYNALEALLRTTEPDTGPIVDFRCLQSASFDVERTREILIVQQVIKTTTQLQSLSIFIDTDGGPRTLAGLAECLNANSTWTLKSATFRILVEGDDFDPLCGLTAELRMLPRNNILEELKLIVEVQTDCPCRTRSNDWADFDAVLTGPGFPSLRRVSVEVGWWSFDRDEAAAENVLNSLTVERFARLSKGTTVAFEFSSHHEYV